MSGPGDSDGPAPFELDAADDDAAFLRLLEEVAAPPEVPIDAFASTAAMTPPSPRPQPGEVLADRYRVEGTLGEGGFAVVLAATDLREQRPVALKLLLPERLAPFAPGARVAAERFRREMAVVARLSHPNIAALLDRGELSDGRLFAVLRRVEGPTLAAVLRAEGALARARALTLMEQVLGALEASHALGVVHRDLKPSNIVVEQRGNRTRAVVLDFGIARVVEDARSSHYVSLTLPEQIVCTPRYAAPEQLRHEPATPATDLYAWGLVFTECLTSRPVVDGQSLEAIWEAHLSERPHPLPADLRGTPLGNVLARAMAKDRVTRFASAVEAREALRGLR